MASEAQIAAAKAELARRERIAAAKAELARRESGKQSESDVSVMDWLMGQVEPSVTSLTGMAGSALGGIAGVGQIPLYASGLSDTSPDEIVRGYQDALTYRPRTETGGKLLDAMGRDYDKYVEKPVLSHLRTGDQTLETTGSPLLATINQIGPEVVGSILGIKGQQGFRRPPLKQGVNPKTGALISALDKKTSIKEQLSAGRATEKTLGYRLGQGGEVVKDALQKKAVKKGWSAKATSWAANQSKDTRAKLRGMLDSAEEYFTNMEAEARPTDFIGKTASEQAVFVNGVRSKAGRAMDVIANGQLAKKTVNIGKLRSDFRIAVRGLRGNIDKDGNLIFSPKSKISSNAGDMRALQELQNKLNAYGSNPTGQELHEFKQWAAGQIKFGKSALNQTEGISAGVEKILNKARVDANKALRKISDPYAKANDIYSETKTALDTLQKGAGNIDMFGEGSETALGTTMNRLLGNAQSRRNVTVGLSKVQDAAIKYKGPFEKQNYTAQMRFVDEMERLWGPFTETSFKAQSGDAAARVMQNPGLAQVGREAIDLSAKQIRKMTQSKAKQLQALRELLYEGGD